MLNVKDNEVNVSFTVLFHLGKYNFTLYTGCLKIDAAH